MLLSAMFLIRSEHKPQRGGAHGDISHSGNLCPRLAQAPRSARGCLPGGQLWHRQLLCRPISPGRPSSGGSSRDTRRSAAPAPRQHCRASLGPQLRHLRRPVEQVPLAISPSPHCRLPCSGIDPRHNANPESIMDHHQHYPTRMPLASRATPIIGQDGPTELRVL
jgi:hypothetical protein